MTWTCPDCDRTYPDSSLGVPRTTDTADKEACKVCWISPPGTVRFVRPDAIDPDEVTR